MFAPVYRSVCQIKHITFSNVIVKLSSCAVYQSKTTDIRIGRIMNKLMKPTKHRKKKYHAAPCGGTPEFLDFMSTDNTSRGTSRRMTVLNKIFMKHITDLMATGELCPEINGRGVQISEVKFAQAMNQVNVHWLANGNDSDIEIQKLLSEFAPVLRHELSQIRIMGVVPKIEFVKDSSYLKLMQVENILKTADFGDDYEYSPLASDWKGGCRNDPSPSSIDKEKINTESEDTIDKDPMPVMRMDVLGLDHSVILARINHSLQRAKGIHRRDPSIKLLLDKNLDAEESSRTLNSKDRKKLIADYLLKKKSEMKKAMKKEKKYRPEIVIHEQEMESNLMNEFLNLNDDCYDEEFDKNSNYSDDNHDVK